MKKWLSRLCLALVYGGTAYAPAELTRIILVFHGEYAEASWPFPGWQAEIGLMWGLWVLAALVFAWALWGNR